jgi:glycosyltransferase involved in cell wall biosynthesis
METLPRQPLVSIVIPTKDRADLLRQTLDSVRNQSCSAWECHVVDDGSRDETEQLVQNLAAEDHRFHCHRRPPGRGGASACRNHGLGFSSGEYVIFLDSDDLLAPQCVANRAAAMEADRSLDFAVFGIELFRDTPGDLGLGFNAPSDRDDLLRFLSLDSVWQTMGLIWRRKALKRLGPWDEGLLSFQDWELHVRALATGLCYRKFKQRDCFCRVGFGRETISARIYSADHLRSHIQLLDKVRLALRASDHLDGADRHALAGLYVWLAYKLRSSGARNEAAKLWHLCLEHRLINRFAWLEGQAYLAAQPSRVMRTAMRFYLRLRWPRPMARKGSRTYHNAPLRADAILRPPRKTLACLYEFPA